jgi:hypothetical protein
MSSLYRPGPRRGGACARGASCAALDQDPLPVEGPVRQAVRVRDGLPFDVREHAVAQAQAQAPVHTGEGASHLREREVRVTIDAQPVAPWWSALSTPSSMAVYSAELLVSLPAMKYKRVHTTAPPGPGFWRQAPSKRRTHGAGVALDGTATAGAAGGAHGGRTAAGALIRVGVGAAAVVLAAAPPSTADVGRGPHRVCARPGAGAASACAPKSHVRGMRVMGGVLLK